MTLKLTKSLGRIKLEIELPDWRYTVTKSTRNAGKPWTPPQVSQLGSLAAKNTPTRVIGLKLGRTPGAVSAKASEQKISLKPTNQRPYGTSKK
jgi:hypothetical protein